MKLTNYILAVACSVQLVACSVQKQIAKHAQADVINDSLLSTAHVGICVYDATDNKYLYNYQSDKYFIPASNTKIATCYAAMKYLGNSLVGLRYQNFCDTAINIFATGDPTFLHNDFKEQPVLDFLKGTHKVKYLSADNWQENALGVGWSWDDYNDDYMAERSPFPVAGNTVKISLDKTTHLGDGADKVSLDISPHYFYKHVDSIVQIPLNLGASAGMADAVARQTVLSKFRLQRNWDDNNIKIAIGNSVFKKTEIPFHTNGLATAVDILAQDFGQEIKAGMQNDNSLYGNIPERLLMHTIHSQPTDSLLKIMMHRSDNFYAEQSLLMVSNEKLGLMKGEAIIDTLLKTDLKELPQRPQWVDGSGLSRFNLFTPQDFVVLLNKMRNEFSWNKITTILETGGTGTLGSYYKSLKGKIYAKTGSLSNNIALSGYLITPKNKTLIFSVLVNNHTVGATAVRRAVERFLTKVQQEN